MVPNKLIPVREDFRLKPCSIAIDAGFGGLVTQPFHSEDVPTLDGEGNARVDMTSVADAGAGVPTFFDMGAVEYTGPDSCDAPPPGQFIRGDANGDDSVDISDGVNILLVLFAGASSNCRDAADANDSGALDIADAIFVLNYLFRSGPAMSAPYPSKGLDPTADALGCTRA